MAVTPQEMQPKVSRQSDDKQPLAGSSDDMSRTDQDLLDLVIVSAGKIQSLYEVPIQEEFLTHKVATSGGGNKVVERDFGECNRDTVKEAFQILRKELATATATMASVPKPLKYLRPFLEPFEDAFDAMEEEDEFRIQLADLLSLMVTVRGTKVDLFAAENKKDSKKEADKKVEKEAEDKKAKDSEVTVGVSSPVYQRSILEYRCAGSKEQGLADWGAEYVRCVTADLVTWFKRLESPLDETSAAMTDKPVGRPSLEHLITMPVILAVGEKCVDYLWQKGAHIEGCDLLHELNRLGDLCQYPLDRIEATRIVEYLDAVAKLLPYGEKATLYQVMFNISLSHGDLVTAMTVALEENDLEKISEVFQITKNIKNKPKASRQTNVSVSDSWAESARVSYEVSKMDAQRLEFECSLRKLMRSQLCYLLARHTLNFPLDDMFESASMDEQESDVDANELESICRILRREYLPTQFGYLTKELDVLQPRNPEDIFKSGWDDPKKRRGGAGLDSHRSALASSYVSGFVHAAFNKDELLTIEDSSHVNRSSQHGITAATAAMGLVHLWNIEEGLTQIDKFQYSSDPYTRAGALIAFGINSTNTSNEADPVVTLVGDAIRSVSVTERLAAYMALGYGYAGTARTDVFELLAPIVLDLEATGGLEASAAAALTLGFVFVGTADEAVAEALLQTLLERSETPQGLDSIHAFNFSLGLALLFLCRGSEADVVIAGLSAVSHPIGAFTCILIESSAHAASGDMGRIENLIQTCISKSEEAINGPAEETETVEPEVQPTAGGPTETPLMPVENTPATEEQPAPSPPAPGPPAAPSPPALSPPAPSAGASSSIPDPAITVNAMAKQVKEDFVAAIPAIAVLCTPLITLREEIGGEMILRLFNHFLQYDNLFVRRAVPIAVALHAASNPKPAIVDLLSRLSHDTDADTALHSIVALGIVGAGSNNARVAQILRGLAHFYGVDANALFLVRVSQGLLYSGKGLMSLSPLHFDRRLLDKNALAGLLAFCVQALFTKDTLCSPRYHLNYFHLAPALHPRWLITLDERMQPVAVPVRVGQAVNTAGLAGQPRKITGFRTHTTPVLLAYDEKAQIGSEEWQPLSHILEGIVIVRRLNPREQTQAARSLE
eukprot:Gregarina_sp_Poly_1__640@NODE_1150_length_4930_cov_138_418877_g792_i0_p1_GENE_NODE_1150_length_4930_cov_138_418877_g792_i0NODE_1150_length_4930_cov_138_418877_g792_i0_p1_ORF_typecomplete_len1128_score219_80RPN1_RPN2_N/PF17781_1/1_8e54RPN1_C/PF18051_1/2e03RPN1_C/PF18051_1/1_2e20PC_rep/PF01851_22/40PC_rep/PF01851_22/8_6PC_rep/PF01851_22/28PC_rep/PF01851_22/7_7e03PC_rep/PF01851_22/6_1e06HEAT_2/PF13646_6/90HEAT_2/PF13646_6/0_58_NODE_1150_length_4930_cov_138_418877_g792_i014984881